MSAILVWLTGRIGAFVAPIGIALAIVGGVFAAGRKGARTEAERDTARRDIENMETRNAADAAAAGEPDPADRLRARWSRPE